VCLPARGATPEMMTMVPGRFTGTRRGYAPTYDTTGTVSLDHRHTPSLSFSFSLFLSFASRSYNIMERTETRSMADADTSRRYCALLRYLAINLNHIKKQTSLILILALLFLITFSITLGFVKPCNFVTLYLWTEYLFFSSKHVVILRNQR